MEYLNVIIFLILMIILYFIPDLYKRYKFKNKMRNSNLKNKKGYVYIISNEYYKENVFKIGMTEKNEFKPRLKELFNTSVPVPFTVEYLIPHEYPREYEKYLHKVFKKYRINGRREFFELSKEKIELEINKLLS